MNVYGREEKLQRELESVKRFAEWCEAEQYKIGPEEGRKNGSSFALIAMAAGSTLEEVIESRECGKTGKLRSYCI